METIKIFTDKIFTEKNLLFLKEKREEKKSYRIEIIKNSGKIYVNENINSSCGYMRKLKFGKISKFYGHEINVASYYDILRKLKNPSKELKKLVLDEADRKAQSISEGQLFLQNFDNINFAKIIVEKRQGLNVNQYKRVLANGCQKLGISKTLYSSLGKKCKEILGI